MNINKVTMRLSNPKKNSYEDLLVLFIIMPDPRMIKLLLNTTLKRDNLLKVEKTSIDSSLA